MFSGALAGAASMSERDRAGLVEEREHVPIVTLRAEASGCGQAPQSGRKGMRDAPVVGAHGEDLVDLRAPVLEVQRRRRHVQPPHPRPPEPDLGATASSQFASRFATQWRSVFA